MKKKILIIDDEQDIVVATKMLLEKHGYEVLTAEFGEVLLVWLRKNMPDLILLDLLLPKMRGEDVCKKIKSDVSTRNIPIILFTASASDLSLVAKDVGADDYVMKPYETEELVQKIKNIIG